MAIKDMLFVFCFIIAIVVSICTITCLFAAIIMSDDLKMQLKYIGLSIIFVLTFIILSLTLEV